MLHPRRRDSRLRRNLQVMIAAMWIFGLSWALVLYTYIGFPLLLAAFARLRGDRGTGHPEGTRGRGAPTPDPRVAMVIAAYNEEAVLAEKLANTWAIDYPADRFQLWIGSDGSSDGTDGILQACG